MVGAAPGARIRSCYCIRNGQYEGLQCRYFVGILQVKQYGTKLLLFCLANIPSIYVYHLQNFLQWKWKIYVKGRGEAWPPD